MYSAKRHTTWHWVRGAASPENLTAVERWKRVKTCTAAAISKLPKRKSRRRRNARRTEKQLSIHAEWETLCREKGARADTEYRQMRKELNKRKNAAALEGYRKLLEPHIDVHGGPSMSPHTLESTLDVWRIQILGVKLLRLFFPFCGRKSILGCRFQLDGGCCNADNSKLRSAMPAFLHAGSKYMS